jgi:hypothetical protein
VPAPRAVPGGEEPAVRRRGPAREEEAAAGEAAVPGASALGPVSEEEAAVWDREPGSRPYSVPQRPRPLRKQGRACRLRV